MGQNIRFVRNNLTCNKTIVMDIIFYGQVRLKKVT